MTARPPPDAETVVAGVLAEHRTDSETWEVDDADGRCAQDCYGCDPDEGSLWADEFPAHQARYVLAALRDAGLVPEQGEVVVRADDVREVVGDPRSIHGGQVGVGALDRLRAALDPEQSPHRRKRDEPMNERRDPSRHNLTPPGCP